MWKANANDLGAFVAVAREQSFTKAAAKMGVSTSALSHTIKGLEERLNLRLLRRTTRSVSPTEVGERLLDSIGPMFDLMDAELAAITEMRETPAGKIRITADEHAIESVLMPALAKFTPQYPDISVEIYGDYRMTDIVAERYDAGVRLGDTVAKDMIAVPIGPPMQSVVVATPAFLEKHGTPSTPHELTSYPCINLRLPTYGGLYAWEFDQGGREIKVRVDGPLVFNSIMPILSAVLNGLGISYLPKDQVQPHVDSGALQILLEEWTPPYPGYYLYYPSRRHLSPAFSAFVAAVKYRAE